MNRKIIFRGWNNKFKCWDYVNSPMEDCALIDQNSVGQFTGLYDKNGKEIYEGDILGGGRTGRYKVVYLNAAFRIVDLHNAYIYEPQYAECLTIIGNIHDNPELLTSE